jgi:serine/threonine protein kinase
VKMAPGYSRTQEISRSTTTVVYRARRDADSAKVVIKVPISDSPSIEQLARLQHEFELLQQVDSPNIVKAYELVDLRPGLAIVLADVGGQPIARPSAAGTPSVELLRIARAVLAGLGELHRRGIVHRDINPADITSYHRHRQDRCQDGPWTGCGQIHGRDH